MKKTTVSTNQRFINIPKHMPEKHFPYVLYIHSPAILKMSLNMHCACAQSICDLLENVVGFKVLHNYSMYISNDNIQCLQYSFQAG